MMLNDYLCGLTAKATKTLENYNLILSTRKEFLTKNLTNVQILELKEINSNFPCVVHATDEYLISCAQSGSIVFFLTVRSLNTRGVALHWYFMRMTNDLWSMERKTLKEVFVERDTFILTELATFFRRVHINRICCKGAVSKQLGMLLLQQDKVPKQKHRINNLLIFDRTVDLLTPTNTKIQNSITEKQMLSILLTKNGNTEKLNTLLNFYVLISLLKIDMPAIKREMVYTYGEKMVVIFDMIDRMVSINDAHIYIPDLCKAVVNKHEQFYCFDVNEGTDEGGENVVLFIGGVCQKEIDDLKGFTVLTTKLISDDLLKELI
ncbi:Vacuolar sorting protein VPS33/slp1 (Sec1 family) [Trachipleistophora hominis]|uniref:Vacuolar sorting protein VPS33/slp1 (Sec1 family) n=1 Tax=Trachipleistophora hominis TaxID=72359 RepID=L7JY85_TRAHO|nr:Vacuolar sorting protein VPS33/slp1 (Sec1 family) [Trachipleistophora hominis]